MKYIVITDFNFDKFIEQVNKKIAEGYSLQGGVSVATLQEAVPSRKFIYSQALIINEIEK